MSGNAHMPASNELIDKITYLLTVGDYDEALNQINNGDIAQVLNDNIWDLLPKVCDCLTPLASVELRKCCEEILLKITDISQPEEAILEFIEQTESSQSSQVKFIALQKVLKLSLYKLTRRGLWLDWCLNAIQYHIATLPTPEDGCNCTEKVEVHPSYTHIIDVYSSTIEFYKSFIYENMPPFSLAEDEDKHQRKSLVCFLLHLLGKPLMNLDLSPLEKKNNGAREIAQELLQDLSYLVNDMFMFLKYVELREMQSRSKFKEVPLEAEYDENQIPVDDYLREDKVTTESLGVFYYLVLAEEMELDKIPHVYDPLYVLHNCLYLATVLLKKTDEISVVRKGLLLAKSVLTRLPDSTVPFDSLGSAVHKEFAEALAVAAVYSEGLQIRKLSISVLRDYVFKFDPKGRYFVMLNLVLLVDHSSLIGYLTMILKDMIIDAMNSQPIPVYFCGKMLMDLLKEFIRLPQGDLCDLADNRDRILASLNILLFLLSRDTRNVTGIWENIENIEGLCLEPLQKVLDVSRPQYKIKLADVASGKKSEVTAVNRAQFNVSTVGGGNIEPPSDMAEMEAIQFALNGFDLMENLLVMLRNKIESGMCLQK